MNLLATVASVGDSLLVEGGRIHIGETGLPLAPAILHLPAPEPSALCDFIHSHTQGEASLYSSRPVGWKWGAVRTLTQGGPRTPVNTPARHQHLPNISCFMCQR